MTPTGYAAIRRCVGWSATARSRALPASASQMGRFETKWLSRPENLAALADLPGQWIDKVHQRRPPRIVVLDMDSSESPTYGEQEGSAYNGHFGCTCYHPLFVFNQLGDVERCALRSGNVHSAAGWRAVLEPVNQHRSGTPERRRHRALLSLIGFTFRVGSYWRRSGPPSTAIFINKIRKL
jgi:Transposase DDE domain group 1